MSERTYCQKSRPRAVTTNTINGNGYILTAVKEFTTGQYIPKGKYGYNITVTNNGNNEVKNIEVIDGPVIFPKFNLLPGKSKTINDSVKLPNDGNDPVFTDDKLTNTATVTSDNTAKLTVEDTVYKPINVLHVSKTADVIIGDTSIKYAVTVTNNANFSITVTKNDISDTLKIDTDIYTDYDIELLPLVLSPGATGTYYITFKDLPAITNTNVITNKLTTVPNVGGATYNDINTDVIIIVTNKDKDYDYILTATKKFTTGQYIPGGKYNYEITVTNNGNSEVKNIEIVDGTTTFVIASLAPGISNTVSGEVILPAATDSTFEDVFGPNGKLVNKATVTSDNTPKLTVEDTVYKPINVLHVSKYAEVEIGDTSVKYIVTVTNNSNFDIDVTKDDISDILKIDANTYTTYSTELLPISSLAPGASGTFFITFGSLPPIVNTNVITNALTVTPTVGDAKYNDINVNVTTIVNSNGGFISASKTTDAMAGQTTVNYVVSVANNTNNPITVTNVIDKLTIGANVYTGTPIGLPITINSGESKTFIIAFSSLPPLVAGDKLINNLDLTDLNIKLEYISFVRDNNVNITCWSETCGPYTSVSTSANGYTIWTPLDTNSDAIIAPTGDGSFALREALAKRGKGSVDFRMNPNKEIGNQVIIGGGNNEAKGDNSFTIGTNNTNSGINGVVVGNNNANNSGGNNTISGSNNKNNSGGNNIIGGNSNIVGGNDNLISGFNNKVDGNRNLMVGYSFIPVSGDINEPYGKYINGDGNINSGYVDEQGGIWAQGKGSIVNGYAYDGVIKTTNDGSFTNGFSRALSLYDTAGKGYITTSGPGSFTTGFAQNMCGYDNVAKSIHIETKGSGSLTNGYIYNFITSLNSDSYEIITNGDGSLTNGCIFSLDTFHTTYDPIGKKTIVTNGIGSLTNGCIYDETNKETKDMLIQNSGNGCLLTGYTDQSNITNGSGDIKIESTCSGSTAHGIGPIYVNNSNGSMTVGRNLKNEVHYCTLIGIDGQAKVSVNGPEVTPPQTPPAYYYGVYGAGSLQIGSGTAGAPDICVIIGRKNTPVGQGSGIADNWANSGADYAEYFELAKVNDKYPTEDELIGKFVYINDDGKAIVAQSGDDVIGVFSSALSNYGILGDTGYFRWNGKNMKDKYNRTIVKPSVRNSISRFMTIPEEYNDLDNEELLAKLNLSEENKVKVETENMPITNPDYDPKREYMPRTCREEWRIVSMLGKIVVRDDGTCKVGKKCTCNADGIAIPGNKWVVMQRISPDTIVILFR